jgi:molybdopterin-guanine dinucleotide biosynthesis protein A
MEPGAIILCGGKSTRMGRDKASLPFGPETMLQRVIRLLNELVSLENVVVVAAAGQVLPDLPSEIIVARDERPERGPLEGLAAGLKALSEGIDAAYVTSCDVPLLVPAFMHKLFELLEGFDIVVPRDGAYLHPLAAVYRRSVFDSVRKLLDADRLRLRFLFEEVRTREVPLEELRAVDPRLETLKNLNTPADYQDALRLAGLSE